MSAVTAFLQWLKGPLFAAAATGAFSYLFGLRAGDISLAAAGAAAGWAVLLAFPAAIPGSFSAFAAAFTVGLYSELVGWTKRRPATVYAIAGIIPLVPGGGMYYTMLASFDGDSAGALSLGVSTLMTAFAIAAGLAASNAASRVLIAKPRAQKLKRPR